MLLGINCDSFSKIGYSKYWGEDSYKKMKEFGFSAVDLSILGNHTTDFFNSFYNSDKGTRNKILLHEKELAENAGLFINQVHAPCLSQSRALSEEETRGLIEKIKITNFRCFDSIGIESCFNKGVNSVIGENNAGKSALIDAIRIAFSAVFSNFAGTFLFVFVVISCIGTLNGLMLGNTRGLYSCAMHSDLKSFKLFKQVDPVTNMATNSAIAGLVLYFYGSVITTIGGNKPWFGQFSFDASELPIVTVYGMYLPIFVAMLFKEKGLGFFKGKIAPVAAIVAALFMVGAAIYAHGIAPYMDAKANGEFAMPILFYLIIYAVIMVIGIGFLVAGNKKKIKK